MSLLCLRVGAVGKIKSVSGQFQLQGTNTKLALTWKIKHSIGSTWKGLIVQHLPEDFGWGVILWLSDAAKNPASLSLCRPPSWFTITVTHVWPVIIRYTVKEDHMCSHWLHFAARKHEFVQYKHWTYILGASKTGWDIRLLSSQRGPILLMQAMVSPETICLKSLTDMQFALVLINTHLETCFHWDGLKCPRIRSPAPPPTHVHMQISVNLRW